MRSEWVKKQNDKNQQGLDQTHIQRERERHILRERERERERE